MSAAERGGGRRWRAVLARDPRADGRFVYAVRTTGVYCRPVCPARRPKPTNVAFHAGPAEAEAAGYRACKLCRPDRLRAAATRAAPAGDVPRLGPAAVLFADIRGFTGLAAGMAPDEALALLRAFHARAAGRVVRHGGVVHKFLGDGLMAVFGQEGPRPDDAARAVACALAIVEAVAAPGWAPAEVGVRVGVHYGAVAFGSTGAAGLGEAAAVVGDTVNVASRLERATRRLGAALAVSDETLRAVAPARAAALRRRLRPAGPVRLNGCKPRRIWTLPGPAAAR